MSNKTEVKITTATKEDTHNIGDYYQLDDELYILANVQGKAVLICLNNGCFNTTPIARADFDSLNSYEFSKCCGSMYGNFVKVQKVSISIE